MTEMERQFTKELVYSLLSEEAKTKPEVPAMVESVIEQVEMYSTRHNCPVGLAAQQVLGIEVRSEQRLDGVTTVMGMIPMPFFKMLFQSQREMYLSLVMFGLSAMMVSDGKPGREVLSEAEARLYCDVLISRLAAGEAKRAAAAAAKEVQ